MTSGSCSDQRFWFVHPTAIFLKDNISHVNHPKLPLRCPGSCRGRKFSNDGVRCSVQRSYFPRARRLQVKRLENRTVSNSIHQECWCCWFGVPYGLLVWAIGRNSAVASIGLRYLHYSRLPSLHLNILAMSTFCEYSQYIVALQVLGAITAL